MKQPTENQIYAGLLSFLQYLPPAQEEREFRNLLRKALYGDLVDKVDWDGSAEEWRLDLVGVLARQGQQVLAGFLVRLEAPDLDLSITDRDTARQLSEAVGNLSPQAYQQVFMGVLNRESEREMLVQIRQEVHELSRSSYVTNTPADQACEPPLPLFVDAQIEVSDDEVDYVIGVGQCFADWVDLQRQGNIEPELIPDRLLDTEVVHRRVSTDQKAQGIKLWSTCELTIEFIRHYRMLILGRSGIGKTSLMKLLARRCADAYKGRVLPIVVSLRGWTGTDEESLVSYIVEFLRNPPNYDSFPDSSWLADHLPSYLAEKRKERRLLFLFDDYDRMLARDATTRPQRVAALQSFLNSHKQAIILVFSRSLAYDGSLDECRPKFSVVEMNPWIAAQIREYLNLNASKLAPYADNPRLWDIGDIPYQLKMAVGLAGNDPDKLEKLLDGLGELMTAFVNKIYSEKVRLSEWNDSMPEMLQATLTRLASAMLQHNIQRGTYLSYSDARLYVDQAETTPDVDLVLQAGGDASLLDLLPGQQGLAFEAQQIETYFQSLSLLSNYGNDPISTPAAPTTDPGGTIIARLNNDQLDPLPLAQAVAQKR
jgi:Cdc6-like AAA superfamily ATPase